MIISISGRIRKAEKTTDISRMLLKSLFAVFLAAVSCCGDLFAQTGADKQINPYHKHYADSLKSMNYKPIFPLLARKAYKKGYDIPLPYGMSLTYFYMRQNIDISSTTIGFNDAQPLDLTDILQYGDVVNTTNVITFRPDLWILPFLNVYGIVGTGTSEVVVPLVEPVNFSTTQRFTVNNAGFGVTLAGGIGPVFLTIDNNMAWAWLEAVEKPVPAYNFDARVGHSFVHPRHPERSLTIWCGVFFQTLRTETKGDIAMSEVMSDETADALKEKIDNKIANDPDLSPLEKQALETFVGEGVDKLKTSTVHYELDKKIAGPWNLIFGAQYQFNKHWQLRCELGTFGQRSQFMLNLNWRFQ